ncbi:MAG TPA: DUF4153 domain-containing protein [Clostridia bacterium]|nr:DUF4153 domain-containing protein [Clostridia bacterium]
MLIYRIETPYEKIKDINDILDRLTGVMSLGVLISLSVSLLLERWGKDKHIPLKIIFFVLVGAFLVLYYLFLFPDTDNVSMTRLLLIMIALALSFFFIPYLPSKERFEIYVTNVITGFATSAFFTVVLGLGVVAILFAIQSLLYSDMDRRLYADTWVLAWLVFAPFHFLYNLPDSNFKFTLKHFNKVIKIALLYIILPVMAVYTLVLYVYFGKIIITQIWPKGIVSYLVVSYTAVGLVAIFLINPFRTENKWVRVFTTVFTKAIFPLLGMMFISIGIRIGEFGFTENRYFILVIGIWSTLMMIFLNLNKGKNNTVLPVSLAIFALLTVIGPWNAFEISKMSQANRFLQIAAKYDLIQDGKVVKTDQNLALKDRQEITGVLSYFDRSHDLSDLKYLPENFTMDQMKSVFGFEPVYATGVRDDYFSYYMNREFPMTISGYDLFFPLEAYRYQDGGYYYEKELRTEQGKVKLILDNECKLTVQKEGQEIYQYDLGQFIRGLYDKYGNNLGGRIKPEPGVDSDRENLVLKNETDRAKLMIVFYNMHGTFDRDENVLDIDGLSGDVFLTVK